MRLDLRKCQFTETDKRSGRAASTPKQPKVRVLVLADWVLGPDRIAYRVLRAPPARKTFHDTCCIIALFGERTRYMNIRRMKRSPFPTILSNRLRAQPQLSFITEWAAPVSGLSLTCSLSRILTAPKWILCSTLSILQRPSPTAGLHR